jgi:hypothetical protein
MGFCFFESPLERARFFSAEVERSFSRRNDVAFRDLAARTQRVASLPTVNGSAVNATLVDDCARLLIWRKSCRKSCHEYRLSASPRHMK